MAAGLGFKDFTTGEVLTAADVDGYLMQGIWVFANATARDAAVTSPQEGNFAFLKDTNVTTYYTGSAWTNLDTTGMVNPMTTTGDTIYSSSGSTPARLAIGTTGQVLTVAGGVPSWATPAAGGGLTLIGTTTFTSVASQIIGGFSSTYTNYRLVMNLTASGSLNLQGRFSASGTPNTTANYSYAVLGLNSFGTVGNLNATSASYFEFCQMRATDENLSCDIFTPQLSTVNTEVVWQKMGFNNAYAPQYYTGGAFLDTLSSYNEIQLLASTGTISGTVRVYGYNN
jgi:hypothetical protein